MIFNSNIVTIYQFDCSKCFILIDSVSVYLFSDITVCNLIFAVKIKMIQPKLVKQFSCNVLV